MMFTAFTYLVLSIILAIFYSLGGGISQVTLALMRPFWKNGSWTFKPSTGLGLGNGRISMSGERKEQAHYIHY